MTRIILISTLLIGLSLALGDEPATLQHEVKTLDGASQKGTVSLISDKEIQLHSGDQDVKLPAADVINVELQPAKAPPSMPYLEIGLMDGSKLLCQAFGLKAKTAELHLFTGHTVNVPLAALRYVLCEANSEAKRQEFEQYLSKRSGTDVLRLLSRDGSAVNTFEGFLGDADDLGETIRFKPEDGEQAQVSLARIRGLVFNRKPDPLPKPVARVFDTTGSVVPVTRIATNADSYHLESPLGLTLDLPKPLAQRFDFSPGKMAYLSDLDPLRSEGELIVAVTPIFTRDKHLEGGPISLSRKTYSKGLSTHARCVLDYDVTGYNYFRSVVGIDDAMEGAGQAVIRIDGDGKELFTTTIGSKDKPQEVELKIANVSKLRLTIDYGDDGDLGTHVDFAEARVMK